MTARQRDCDGILFRLPEHDTRIQDVVADKVCTDEQNDISGASMSHVLSSASMVL